MLWKSRTLRHELFCNFFRQAILFLSVKFDEYETKKLDVGNKNILIVSQNLTHMKGSHDALLRQLEDTNSQLKQEQSRVVSLQSQLKRNPPEASRLIELDEQINDLSRENAILKEANENLVSRSVFV